MPNQRTIHRSAKPVTGVTAEVFTVKETSPAHPSGVVPPRALKSG